MTTQVSTGNLSRGVREASGLIRRTKARIQSVHLRFDPIHSCIYWELNLSYSFSSVLKAVTSDGTFIPRAVARNPESDASKAFKVQGIEVVKGDLYYKESIKEAIKAQKQ
jgi:hypothetical protein